MDEFRQYLLYKKEVTGAKLKIIDRFLKQSPQQSRKRTSNIDIVRYVLQAAGEPLHVSEIIHSAKQSYNVELNRDSIVSAILKKINAGQSFVRTAPNTFFLKTDSIE